MPKEPKSRLTEIRQGSRTLPQRQRQRVTGELTQLTCWMGQNSVQNRSNAADRQNCSRMRNNAALVSGKRRRSRDPVAMLNNHGIRKFNGAIGFKSRGESPIHVDRCTSDSQNVSAETNRIPPGCRQHPLQGQRTKRHPKFQLLEQEDLEDQQIIIPKLLHLDRLSKLDQKPPPRAKQQHSKPTQSRPLPPGKQQNHLLLLSTRKNKKHRDVSYCRDFSDTISMDAEAAQSHATGDNSEPQRDVQHQLRQKQTMIFKPTATANSGIHSLHKLQKQFTQLYDESTAVCGSPVCSSPFKMEKDGSDRKRKAFNCNRDGSCDVADQSLHHSPQTQPLLPQPLLPHQLSQTSIFESESLVSPSTESTKQLCCQSPQPLAEKQPDQQWSQPPTTQSPPESESVPLLKPSQSYENQSSQIPSPSTSEPLSKNQSPICQTINSRQKTMPTTEKQTPTCDDNNSLESECSIVQHQRLHIVDGLTSFQHSQQQLCTSSSNCCGGSKRNKSSEISLESSLNLVSGTSSLSRPGSLNFINIDGLAARRLCCTHENLKNGDLECKENKEFNVNLRRKSELRSSKKRVSFASACTNREDKQDTDGQVTSVATCTSAVSMDTIQEDFTFEILKTDTDISELDSDTCSREISGSKSVSLTTYSGVATTIPIVSISPKVPPQVPSRVPPRVPPRLSLRVPPPVPPHAIGSQILTESNIVNENSIHIQKSKSTNSILTDLTDKTSKRFWADRTYILRTADAQLTEDSNDTSTSFFIDGAFDLARADLGSQEVASNRSVTTTCNWKSATTESSAQKSETNAAQEETWNESNSTGFELLHKRPEGDKRSIEISVRQLNPQNNSGHFQNPTDTKTISSQLGSHTSGSNCANSTIGLRRHVDRNQNRRCRGHDATHHSHHRHGPVVVAASQMPAVNAPTCTGSQILRPPLMSPTQANRNENGYVVFNHPPEVSTAAKSTRCYSSLRGSSARVSDARLDELPEGENCSESIAFSWVTTLDNDSNAVDLSMSLNGLIPSINAPMSSRRNNSAGCSQDYCHKGKVKFNQLNTTEDCLTSIKSAAPTSARIADVSSRESILKPSAVRDSATMYSVAKCVTRSESSDQVCSYDSSESDSDHPFLMLETLSCGHKDQEHNGCSISCRSYTPPNMRPESRASATARSLPVKGAPNPATASAARRQQSFSKMSTSAPPPPQPLAPRAKSRSSPPAPLAASMSAVSQVSAAADAVRDLLARACDDPVEATALTQALVRGLVCNVESLRSALAATLLLLKDRRSVTGPLAQAIGTAKALDELIRQFQDSEQQQQQQKQQQKQQIKLQHSTTSSDEDNDLTFEKASNANAAGRLGKSHKQSTAVGRIMRRNSLSRCSAASRETIQCHAMAHYTVGDEFVVPSLEQYPNLECRPATTRVVRTESKAVNLAGDRKRRGP